MKGTLKKTKDGWVVVYLQHMDNISSNPNEVIPASAYFQIPIHPDNEPYCNKYYEDSYEEEVEWEKVLVCTYCGGEFCDNLRCNGHPDDEYARLVQKEESWAEIGEEYYKEHPPFSAPYPRFEDWLKQNYHPPKKK